MPQKSKKKIANKNKGEKNGNSRTLLLSSEIEGTVYGQVDKAFGSCNFNVLCYDGRARLCHVRASIKKKQKAEIDSIVLIGLRDFEENKGDIIYVYTKDESCKLRQIGEIPSLITNNEIPTNNLEENILFEEVINFDEI